MCWKPIVTACRPAGPATATRRSRPAGGRLWYDPYLGVVVIVRMVDGVLKQAEDPHDAYRRGLRHRQGRRVHAQAHRCAELGPGEVGFFTASIKEVATPGRRHDHRRAQTDAALPGYKEVVPVVFCGLFPVDAGDFEDLRAAMGKLRLNDASFTWEMETSAALGMGFRCGFLGLLHLEIIQERLSREFDLDLIATAPVSGLRS
jgi:GTP-binding protein LepA